MNQNTTFFIDKVPVKGDLILAPMDGITDMPFRGLCRELGSALSVTEFINTLDVLEGNPRYIPRLAFTPFQRPLSLQLLGDHTEQILEAALQLVHQVQPDILDINLGCQSKNVTSRGAGAALMRTPKEIAAIFQRLTACFSIPVTAKIRLGWDDQHKNYLEVARIIEDNGGSMVAVHGRTRQQGYHGEAQWEPIGEIKQALSIPVIGNGDVKTVEDIRRMQQVTGCDAVMIGRAAVGNPWIFSRLDREQVPIPVVRSTIFKHFDAMLKFYGDWGVILFRKHLKAYLQPYQPPKEVLGTLLTMREPEIIKDRIRIFFEEHI
jgi:nifR3 family TIM-barrel protein